VCIERRFVPFRQRPAGLEALAEVIVGDVWLAEGDRCCATFRVGLGRARQIIVAAHHRVSTVVLFSEGFEVERALVGKQAHDLGEAR
jgi:hypothetical protein